jgi:hypothetical protein
LWRFCNVFCCTIYILYKHLTLYQYCGLILPFSVYVARSRLLLCSEDGSSPQEVTFVIGWIYLLPYYFVLIVCDCGRYNLMCLVYNTLYRIFVYHYIWMKHASKSCVFFNQLFFSYPAFFGDICCCLGYKCCLWILQQEILVRLTWGQSEYLQ